MKDPYEILGVARNASREQIRKAYRQKARELHPDRHPDDPEADNRFKDVTAAHDLLSDSKKRKAFDHGGTDMYGNRNQRARAGSGKHPFDRFFRQRTGRGGGGFKVRGANVSYVLTIDFLEAARGATKRINMTNGKRLAVTVPPGTEDEQVLRLQGQGMAGTGGGANGDALVEIRVTPHPLFRPDGKNIHIDLPITLQEAVLGGKVEAPTVDGPVAVTVPEGANTGTVLRLKGKGLAKGNGARGDQYVELQVVLPPPGNAEFKKFVQGWAPHNPYEVRKGKRSAKQDT